MAAPDRRRLPRSQKAQTASGTLEYILSRRQGAPTLVLVNGSGVGLRGWSPLFPLIEPLGSVFAYNRFGVGRSARPGTRQSGAVAVAALRELLGAAGLAPPYVLVGHSLGGLFANLFARLHPGEVAACMLLEATHPKDRALLREHEGQLLRALGSLFRLPQQLFRDNLHSELKWVDETAAQLEAAGPFPQVPLAVVSGGRAPPAWLMPPAAVQARRRHQEQLAQLSPRGEHVIAQRSGHFPQLSEPRLVAQVLGRLLQAAALSEAPTSRGAAVL